MDPLLLALTVTPLFWFSNNCIQKQVEPYIDFQGQVKVTKKLDFVKLTMSTIHTNWYLTDDLTFSLKASGLEEVIIWSIKSLVTSEGN